MSLLKRAKKLLGHAFNQAESLLHKAKVQSLPPAPGPAPAAPRVEAAMPASLTVALANQGAELTEHRAVPPKLMAASAAKATLATTPAVAFSTDANGLIRWHLPKPGKSLHVWLDHAEEGRNFVVAKFGAFALDALRDLEQGLKHPPIKRFPQRSLQEAGIGDGILQVLHGIETMEDVPDGGPVLVLIHGIFDFALGTVFAPILLRGNLLGRLQRHYGNRVFGYDHPTLSVDPLENARDLAARLPPNTPIDILCHSRGGLVTRALLQHPKLEKARENLKIRNVIFMGAANEGSPLAEPAHLEDLLATFTGMFSASARADVRAAHLDLLVKAARVLLAPGAKLPGVAALRPGSQLIGDLSGATTLPVEKYTFIAAHFDHAANAAVGVVEPISDRVFEATPNDLVVPLAGMSQVGKVPPRQELDPDLTLDRAAPQGHVYHLNYLDSQAVRDHIAGFLGVP